MNRTAGKLVLRREAQGCGRLAAYGIDAYRALFLEMMPPRFVSDHFNCELYDGSPLPASVLATALGLRIKTFREWSLECDFPDPYLAEEMLPSALQLDLEMGNELLPGEWEEHCDPETFGKRLRRGEHLWCGEALGDWIFATRGLRVHHAYAWWILEREFGTWTPEDGYIRATPITLREWQAMSSLR